MMSRGPSTHKTAELGCMRSKNHDSSKSIKKRRRYADEGVDISPSKKHCSMNSSKLSKSDKNSESRESIDLSPFRVQISSLYLPLAPKWQGEPLEGLCAEHLSPLLLTYYPPFSGVILSFANPRLSSEPYHDDTGSDRGHDILAHSIDEFPASFVWITAEFLVFRPQRGGWIDGRINLQSEGHLGLLCFGLFNASIERKRLPRHWSWAAGGPELRRRRNVRDEEGDEVTEDNDVMVDQNLLEEKEIVAGNAESHFKDGNGNRVHHLLRFRVKDVETWPSSDREKGFLSIEGTLLNESEEMDLQEQEWRSFQGRYLEANHSMSKPLTMGQYNGADDEILSPVSERR